MSKILKISNIIKPFNKSISIEGDKSLSIRWALLASQASGVSVSSNLLRSEDVVNTLNCLKKLGIKIILTKNHCKIIGNGLNKFNYKKLISLLFAKIGHCSLVKFDEIFTYIFYYNYTDNISYDPDFDSKISCSIMSRDSLRIKLFDEVIRSF